MADIDETPTIISSAGINPSYASTVNRYYSPGAGANLSNIMHGAGNSMSSGGSGVALSCYRDSGNTGNFYNAGRIDIILDLRDYMMLFPISSAIMYGRVGSLPYGVDSFRNIYTNPDNVALVRSRETYSGASLPSHANHYYEIYYGGFSFGAMSATRHLFQNHVTGTWMAWTLNSAGLAYLNSVPTKSTYPGYAWFGLMFGNDIDGEGGLPWNNNMIREVQYDYILLRMTYNSTSPATRIKVGGAWHIVRSVQVKQNGVWKYVNTVDVKVGTWKDVV